VSHPVFNASGELLELVGTAVDVTERSAPKRTFSKARGDTDTSSRWSAYPSGKKILSDQGVDRRLEGRRRRGFSRVRRRPPGIRDQAISMVKIVDVNDVTLELFAAGQQG